MALSDERRMQIVQEHRDSCYFAIGSDEYNAALQEKLVAAEEMEHMSAKDRTRMEKNNLEEARQQQVKYNRDQKRKAEIMKVEGDVIMLKAQLEVLQVKLKMLKES